MAKSSYTKKFTTYGGADITATFNGQVIGELQAITYSVAREKAPVYTLGDPNPRSFSRGKRGIAGSLVFTVFDRDALHRLKNANHPVYRHGANSTESGGFNADSLSAAHEAISEDQLVSRWATGEAAKYSDEIPPFDITIKFLNEYGQSAKMTIYGVEIMNEGMGMSVDDITTEKSCSFNAISIDDMQPDVHEQR